MTTLDKPFRFECAYSNCGASVKALWGDERKLRATMRKLGWTYDGVLAWCAQHRPPPKRQREAKCLHQMEVHEICQKCGVVKRVVTTLEGNDVQEKGS